MSGRPLSKRIPKEVMDAQSELMQKSGIYYWFDEADMRVGKALIIGPEGTPYAYCPLLFSFRLPDDYPFNPPSVQILTSDGQTRFHPNLYVLGKVCLSILGTWTGPKWSAVMNISTVLSSIQSLLEENPIINEPGYEKLTLDDVRAKAYAEFVRARLVALSIRDLDRWRKGQCPAAWEEFKDVLDQIGENLFQKLACDIREQATKGDVDYHSIFYSMGGTTSWNELLKIVGPADA